MAEPKKTKTTAFGEVETQAALLAASRLCGALRAQNCWANLLPLLLSDVEAEQRIFDALPEHPLGVAARAALELGPSTVAVPPPASPTLLPTAGVAEARLAAALESPAAAAYARGWLCLARLQLARGEARAAAASAKRGLAATSGGAVTAALRLTLGLALSRGGEHERAARELIPLVSPTTVDDDVLHASAEAAMAADRLDECERMCRIATSRDSECGWARAALGWLKFVQAEGTALRDEAAADLEAALERLPAGAAARPRAAYWLARARWRLGATAAARSKCLVLLLQATKAAPLWAPPFELLAHVYHAAAGAGGGAKATANALEAAEKAVTLDARRAAAGELMAVLLARGDGGDADAAGACEEALLRAGAAGGCVWARLLVGRYKLRDGDADGAALHFQRAAADAPSEARAWEGLALTYERQGRLRAAAGCTRQLLELRTAPPAAPTADPPLGAAGEAPRAGGAAVREWTDPYVRASPF